MNATRTIIINEEVLDSGVVQERFGFGPKKSETLLRKCPGSWMGQDGRARALASRFYPFIDESNAPAEAPLQPSTRRRRPSKRIGTEGRDLCREAAKTK